MTSLLARPYNYLHRLSHTQPVIFWSLLLGGLGPVLVLTVPNIRRSFGWKPLEPVPESYPVPNRARDASLTGYEDGWKLPTTEK